MTEYVTAADAAERPGVSRITVWRWIRAGHFDGVHRMGLSIHSTHLIPLESVEKVADELRVAPGDVVLDG